MTLSDRGRGGLIAAASAAILGAAFAFQYLGGLAPCVLCLYQRVPYAAAIALGALIVLLANRRAARWLALAAGLVFLAGGAIAFFHVGVEQHWWQGTDACSGTIESGLTVEQLRERLLAAPVVRCDEVAWSLFGISMAGYNVLLSLALAAIAFAGVPRRRRR